MIPIVFIHSGYNAYLEYSLRQSRLSNPESTVFLLGDDANQHRFPFVAHVSITTLNSAKSADFRHHYVHLSTNPEWYELICFMRWFYLLTFMEQRRLDEVFVADSDIMLYKNLDQYAAWKNRSPNQQSAFCIAESEPMGPFSWIASAHSSFWTRPGIADFCEYLLEMYQIPERRARLEEKWQVHQETGSMGGVSDMALLYLYEADRRGRVINLLQPSGASGQPLREVFDVNIGIPDNQVDGEFELGPRSLKKVRWEPPNYVAYNRVLGENCIFNTLHFQGLSKRYMHRYYQGTDLRLHQLGQEASYTLSPLLKPLYRLKDGLKRTLNH
ncbi:hypothetical protein ACFQ4C_18180 [Larkinella insperata]|uniref:Uncharacterized protein n=1 Tax=Larkinella insperata TaxID=332158 RepID=A0ABW3QNC0_9BACT|nr:hypothetical protein [Larkinella insperata]